MLLFDIPDEMKAVRFSVEGQRRVMFSHSVVPPGRSVFLWRVPAGSYCLENFYSGRYRFERRTNQMMCFPIEAGAINYPGSFSWLAGWRMTSAVTKLAFDPAVLVRELNDRYPQVFALSAPWSFGTNSGADADMARLALLADAAHHQGLPVVFASLAQKMPVDAMRAWGDSYRTAAGFKRDPALALQWYRQAVAGGDARAAALACQQLDLGLGVAEDAMAAVVMCRLSAERGDGVGAWLLSRLHARGRGGLGVDLNGRAELLAQAGDELVIASTIADSTWGFRDGKGRYPDAATALRLARLRAERGVLGGALELAHYYAEGIGTPVDGPRALDLLRQCVEGGSGEALLRLATVHWAGRAVPRDLVKAKAYFEQYAVKDALNVQELVLFLATVADPAFRDGPRAVALQTGLIACFGESAARLEALAAAHAAAGNFEAAMKMQGRASLKALREGWPDSEFPRIKARHALYKAGQVFTQSP